MQNGHVVDLSYREVLKLVAYTCDFADGELPPHGQPLSEVIGNSGGRDWLEAAVLAGYLPHVEGIELALRGCHALHLRQLDECVREDVLGDALGWTMMADDYRQLAALLESQAAELERWKAGLHHQLLAQPVIDERVPRLWREDASAAELRAVKAGERAAQALTDNCNAAKLRQRYTSTSYPSS